MTENYPAPKNKRMTEDEVVAQLSSGMTIGIGGWGSRRKPMSLIRAILRSDLTDLHVVAFGGPEIGILAASGKLTALTFAFVAPDVGAAAVLDPHFRAARQAGRLACTEMDEGMMLLGLQAAAWRMPFLPTRVGLGSDLPEANDQFTTITSPFPGPSGQFEELVAQPAIPLDAALVHLNVADDRGNAAYTGPDVYFDDLLLEAAEAGFVSAERIVPSGELIDAAGDVARLRVNRMFVNGVVEAPNGSHPTSCEPDRPRDEAFQQEWFETAKDAGRLEAFQAEWFGQPDEAAYQAALTARTQEDNQ